MAEQGLESIPLTAACQASLSITRSWCLLKLMSIKSVIPSNHLILCHPLLLLPSIFLSIRVFSSESVSLKINHAASRTHTVLRRRAWHSPEFTLLPSGGGWWGGGLFNVSVRERIQNTLCFWRGIFLPRKFLLRKKSPQGFYSTQKPVLCVIWRVNRDSAHTE